MSRRRIYNYDHMSASREVIEHAAQDNYVKFVTNQVMSGVVEHDEVPVDWIEPRVGHIEEGYPIGAGQAYEAVRLSEETLSAQT